MFVIKCTKGKECGSYMGIDRDSGGYPYWCGFIGQAKIFKTFQEAKDYLSSSLFRESDRMSDGTEFPPMMIHSASGVCHKTPKGDYIISIIEITETVVDSPLNGTAEIKYNAY